MPTTPRLLFTSTIRSTLLPTTAPAAAASITIPTQIHSFSLKQMSTNTLRFRGNGANRPSNPASEIRTISKALSYTLRHGAVREGLALQDDGYANVAELLQLPKFRKMNLTFEKLRQVVSENDKQRFSLTSTTPSTTATATEAAATAEGLHTYLIRATQGHSLPLTNTSTLLTPLPPNVTSAVHGTFYPAYEAILACGHLSRMGRTHIHLATGEVGVRSGMRADAQVLFYVNVERARREGGIEFWVSENGVVLTTGDELGRLGLGFVERVVSKSLGVLWEGGRVVKELPEEVKGGRMPVGKGHVRMGRGGGRRGGEGRERRGRGRGWGRDRDEDAGEGTSGIGVVDP